MELHIHGVLHGTARVRRGLLVRQQAEAASPCWLMQECRVRVEKQAAVAHAPHVCQHKAIKTLPDVGRQVVRLELAQQVTWLRVDAERQEQRGGLFREVRQLHELPLDNINSFGRPRLPCLPRP